MATIPDECDFTTPTENLSVRTTCNTDKIIISKDLTPAEAASLVYLSQQEGETLEVKIKLEEA